MQASSLRKGMFVNHLGGLYEVVDFQHTSPGKGRAFVQLKTKEISSGKILTTKYSSTEDVENVFLDSRPVQYLYSDAEGLHFMDMSDYHSFSLTEDAVGSDKNFLVENMEISILFNDEVPVKIELPRNIVLEVTEAAPGIKGDSVSNNNKTVTLETGLKIQVPLFINSGEKIKVDTVEGQYLGRE